MQEREDKKQALVSRLRRIEGQLRGIQAMIQREEDCAKVAQQLAASRKALDKAFCQLLTCAIEQEVEEAKPDPAVRSKVQQVAELFTKYG